MCQILLANNKILRLHERCRRIISNDKMLSFVELQAKDVSSAVHTRNVQFLLAKMSKVYQDMFTELLRELFRVREILYGLKHPSHFAVFVRTTS